MAAPTEPGGRLRALRRQRGLKQDALARRLERHPSTISRWESGNQEPDAETRLLLARELGVGVEELGFSAGQETSPGGTPATILPAGEGLDRPMAVLRRVQRLEETNADEATLDLLEQTVLGLAEVYDRVHPSAVALEAAEQRRWVDGIIQGQQHPGQRARLYLAAARLSCILAAVALDIGRPMEARAYAAEAFSIAGLVQRADLQAWARSTQSLIEYYSGRYVEALRYARDGERLAPRSVARDGSEALPVGPFLVY